MPRYFEFEITLQAIEPRIWRRLLLRTTSTFADLHRIFPHRIVNQTNGITPRRWLNQCNQPLAALITSKIGHGWTRDLRELLGRPAPDYHYRAVVTTRSPAASPSVTTL